MLPFSKKTAIIISIFSALLASVADVLLLYDPAGNYLSGDYQFLKAISKSRLLTGHYLGMLCIPMYIFGFYVIYDLFEATFVRLSKTFFWLSSLLLFPGVAYHTYCSALAIAIQDQRLSNGTEQLTVLKLFSEPMAVLFILGFMLFSSILAWAIFKQKLKLSRGIAFFNPIVTYLFCFLIYFAVPFIGNYIIVSGFNLSILVLFTAIAVDQWNTGLSSCSQ